MAGADSAPPAPTPLNPRTDTTRRREHSHIALRPSDVTFGPSPASASVRIDRRWNKDWRHRDHNGHRILTTASIVDIVHPGMGTGDAVSIGGSRRYPDLRAVFQEVRALPTDTLVLTGATHGVDAAVREAALRTGSICASTAPASTSSRRRRLPTSPGTTTSSATPPGSSHSGTAHRPGRLRPSTTRSWWASLSTCACSAATFRRDRRQEDPAPPLTSPGDIAVTSRGPPRGIT